MFDCYRDPKTTVQKYWRAGNKTEMKDYEFFYLLNAIHEDQVYNTEKELKRIENLYQKYPDKIQALYQTSLISVPQFKRHFKNDKSFLNTEPS